MERYVKQESETGRSGQGIVWAETHNRGNAKRDIKWERGFFEIHHLPPGIELQRKCSFLTYSDSKGFFGFHVHGAHCGRGQPPWTSLQNARSNRGSPLRPVS